MAVLCSENKDPHLGALDWSMLLKSLMFQNKNYIKILPGWVEFPIFKVLYNVSIGSNFLTVFIDDVLFA